MTSGWRDRPAAHLTRHFFGALFDLGFLTTEGSDAFVRTVIGIFSAIIGLGLMLGRMYMGKYAALKGLPDPAPYLRAFNADTMLAFGLPMWVIAFIAVLVSHSLVPDETDFRVLMPLPVRQRFVFGAKLLALFLFIGLFTVTILVAVTPMYAIAAGSRYAPMPPPVSLLAMLVVGASACVFAVLAVVAVNGLMAMCLPTSRVHVATAVMRSAMLAALMLILPLVMALPADADLLDRHSPLMFLAPPAWFLGIDRVVFGGADDYLRALARTGGIAFATASAIAAATYALLYYRFDRVMLRSLQVSRRRLTFGAGVPRSMRAAISRFTLATLRRSALHQGVLVGVSACGISIALNRIVDPEVIDWLKQPGTPGFGVILLVMGAPWLLMFIIGLATRSALALPIEVRANWIFRMTEDDASRPSQLHAVTRLLRQTTVVVPLVVMAPLEYLVFGWRAAFSLGMNAVCALLWVEVLLRSWRRIPFTSTYMPGGQTVAQTAVVGLGALVLGVTVTGALAVSSARSPLFFAAGSASLGGLALWLRRWRLEFWEGTPLEFEDSVPSAVEGLTLSR